MQTATRTVFNRYLERQAELNGADVRTVEGGKAFTVSPSVQQKLVEKQQDTSSFLQAINLVTVDEAQGEVLGLTIGGPLTSRTDTTANDRVTQDPTGFEPIDYTCKQTNSDTHLSYAKLDQWAKFPDFQTRIRDVIVKRQALDRIMVGFNGTTAAVATNIGANPLGQDVNVGWLQKLRDYNGGARHLATGATAGHVTISPTGAAGSDYKNIDALVFDVIHNLLPPWAQNDPELVVVLSRDLLADKYFPLVNDAHDPLQINQLDLILAAKRVGGLAANGVPFFPNMSLMITRLDNLSIYEQAGKRRRTIFDHAARDRVETYESSNDAYVVENFDFACFVENIQIVA